MIQRKNKLLTKTLPLAMASINPFTNTDLAFETLEQLLFFSNF